MRRYSSIGNDVTDNPNLWKSGDCEIVRTQYHHPDITEGMHTNGPASIWIREAGWKHRADGRWINTGSHKMHDVIEQFIQFGTSLFRHYERRDRHTNEGTQK